MRSKTYHKDKSIPGKLTEEREVRQSPQLLNNHGSDIIVFSPKFSNSIFPEFSERKCGVLANVIEMKNPCVSLKDTGARMRFTARTKFGLEIAAVILAVVREVIPS